MEREEEEKDIMKEEAVFRKKMEEKEKREKEKEKEAKSKAKEDSDENQIKEKKDVKAKKEASEALHVMREYLKAATINGK